MKTGFTVFILAIFFLLSSCSKEKVYPSELLTWVRSDKNGLKKKKTIGEIEFSAMYEPSSYVIAGEEKTDRLSISVYEKRKKELQGLQYYTVRINSLDPAHDILTLGMQQKSDYFSRENYLSFEAQNDIFLCEGKDTLLCSLYHFVNPYGIAPYVDLMLGFPASKEESESGKAAVDKELVMDDGGFGSGILKWTFRKNDINKVPNLITYKD